MNPLRELLGLELPIVQAPMAGAQGSALAIAVSSAGGLGSLPCGILGPDDVRRELAAIRAGTDRPFNVNFFVSTPPTPDPERARRWRELLSPYAGELGIAPPTARRRARPGASPRRWRSRRGPATRGQLPLRPAAGGAAGGRGR
ncbi:MAG: nitronate monooxygenase [Gemmatimonadales bacterium]